MVAATPTPFGGWSVVTLVDMPEFLEVGKSTTLAFRIRQHGSEIRWDVSPTVSLPDPGAGFVARMFNRNRVHAEKGDTYGVYEATITPEAPGEIAITIDTDVHGWKVELLPMLVVAQDNHPPAFSEIERGRRLFAAKGCVTCHEKIDDPALAELTTIRVGPSLTGRTFPTDYLAMRIKNPAENRGTSINGTVMPQLELDVRDIEALVRYINHGTVADETEQ